MILRPMPSVVGHPSPLQVSIAKEHEMNFRAAMHCSSLEKHERVEQGPAALYTCRCMLGMVLVCDMNVALSRQI